MLRICRDRHGDRHRGHSGKKDSVNTTKKALRLHDAAAVLSGGTFIGGILHENGTLVSLLAEGYAYQKADGSWLESDSESSSIDETVTVRAIPVNLIAQPTAEQESPYGDPATLSVTVQTAADAAAEPTYQWYLGDTAIPGATASTYTTPNDLALGEYTYTCQVTCDGYTVTSGEAKVTVTEANPSAPALTPEHETILGKADGKIAGLTTDMEYSTSADGTYTKVTDPAMTFAPGTYYVRYAAKPNYNASDSTPVTINAGAPLTVTLPASQTGYTLTADKAQLSWQESVTLTFTLADGYSKTDAFTVKVNGEIVTLDAGGKYTVSSPEESITVTVEGVMTDITAPEASSPVPVTGDSTPIFLLGGLLLLSLAGIAALLAVRKRICYKSKYCK